MPDRDPVADLQLGAVGAELAAMRHVQHAAVLDVASSPIRIRLMSPRIAVSGQTDDFRRFRRRR